MDDGIEIAPHDFVETEPQKISMWDKEDCWAEKGDPKESFPIQIGDKSVRLVNFNANPMSDEQKA